MSFKRLLIPLFIIFFSYYSFGQNSSELLQHNINDKVGFLVNQSEKYGKDTNFYNSLNDLKKLLDVYKVDVGFDEFYSDNSILYVRESIMINPSECLAILEENIQHFKRSNPKHSLENNYHELANFYFKFGYLEKASDYYFENARIFEKVQDWISYGFTLIDLGNLYFSSEQYSVAKFYYDKAKEVFLKYITGDDLDYCMALYYNNNGLVELNLNNTDKAFEYFKIAYNYRLKSNRENLYSQSYYYFQMVYRQIGMKDSAVYYFNKTIDIQQEMGLYGELIGTLMDYSEYMVVEGQFDDALSTFNHINILIDKYNFPVYKTKLSYNIGILYNKLEQFDSAYYFMLKADSLSRVFYQKDFEELANMALIELCERNNDYKEEVKYYKRYIEILNENSKTNILKKEVQMQIAERKREESLNEEIANNNKRIIFNQAIALFLLIGIILLSAIAIYRYRKQRKILRNVINHRDLAYSIIAHDLRGPIGGVYSGLDLIEKGEVHDVETIKEIVSISHKSINTAYQLLENLLIWANYETNKNVFVPQTYFVNDILETVISLLEETAIKKRIELVSKINCNCRIFVDKNMISAIFRNLVSNAIKFSFPGSKIIFSSESFTDFCKVSIKDTGMGMSSAVISNIMNSKEIKSSLGTSNEKGSGLGLIILKDFIKKNNGYFTIESQVGKGTTFNVFLPKPK